MAMHNKASLKDILRRRNYDQKQHLNPIYDQFGTIEELDDDFSDKDRELRSTYVHSRYFYRSPWGKYSNNPAARPDLWEVDHNKPVENPNSSLLWIELHGGKRMDIASSKNVRYSEYDLLYGWCTTPSFDKETLYYRNFFNSKFTSSGKTANEHFVWQEVLGMPNVYVESMKHQHEGLHWGSTHAIKDSDIVIQICDEIVYENQEDTEDFVTEILEKANVDIEKTCYIGRIIFTSKLDAMKISFQSSDLRAKTRDDLTFAEILAGIHGKDYFGKWKTLDTDLWSFF
jgi:hypothetical protein